MSVASKRPTFVLVHGAWHRPAHGEKLVAALKAHGYNTVAPALASVIENGAPIPETMQPDIDVVRKAVMDVLDDGSDVIVVTHSYGGLPGSAALEGLDPATRKKQGFQTSVVALAGISTFFQPVGWTAADGREQNPPQIADPSGKATMPLKDPEPYHWFYHDLPKEEAEKYTSMLKPMSLMALMDKSKFAAYEVIPTHYLLCTQDYALLYEGQKLIVQRMKDAGANVREETIVSSHSPFLSMPERTADFLRRTAGENIPE